MLHLNLLGSFSLTRDDTPLTGFISNKVQALLVYLAVTQRTHTRDTLAALLWQGVPEKVAKHSLRQALSNLRKIVPEGVVITRQTVSAAAINTDTSQFDSLIGAGRLADAAVLYKGEFLEGFFVADAPRFETWQVVQRERRHRQAFELFYDLQTAAQGSADLPRAIEYARRLQTLEPWHEPTHRCLMRLFAQRGDYASGLAQFAACRQLLQDELGVAPERATQELYERIKAARQRTVRRWVAPPALIGRNAELAQLKQLLLSGTRIVSLTAPGGFGKTHIAQQLAYDMRLHWLEGVYFVPLAAVTDEIGVLTAIAQTVQVEIGGEGEILAQLQRWLARRELLLVLDNCEQLVGDWFAALITALLDGAPQLTLLLTSRERLQMGGEQVMLLEGLAAESAAVDLFLTAVRRQQLDFVPDTRATRAISTICRAVGNVPLALELAAAQIDLFGVDEIAHAITASLDTLATTQRQIAPRQRSIRAVFDTSWARLNADERELLAGLSIFVAGCTLAAAQAIVGATPARIRSLVNKSLLTRQGKRWVQHPLLQQFSAEKLAQNPTRQQALQNAHADYFAHFLNTHFADIQLLKQPTLQQVAADLPNITRAWRHALTHAQISNVAISFRPLSFFYDATNRIVAWKNQFRFAVEQLDKQPDAPASQQNPLLAGILVAYGTALDRSAEFTLAHTIGTRSLAIATAYQFTEAMFHATLLVGRSQHYFGDYACAITHIRAALDLSRQLADAHAQARTLQSLGGSLLYHGKIADAKAAYSEAQRLFIEVGDKRGEMYATMMLGQVAYVQGEVEHAWRDWHSVLAHEGLQRHKLLAGMLYDWITAAHFRRGAYREALESADQALAVLDTLTFTAVYFNSQILRAHVYAATDQLDQAQQIEAQLQPYAHNSGSPLHRHTHDVLRGVLFIKLGDTVRGLALLKQVQATPASGWLNQQMVEHLLPLLV